jgi:hypothetical protein
MHLVLPPRSFYLLGKNTHLIIDICMLKEREMSINHSSFSTFLFYQRVFFARRNTQRGKEDEILR